MSYQSFEQILQKCHTEGKEFWQVILEDDMAVSYTHLTLPTNSLV